MDNLSIYNLVRKVPEEAQKTIQAGRLKGMTDINPQWRIQTLTQQFGACGFGWYYEVTKQWVEECGDERVAFVNINLFVNIEGNWSSPIFGTGGSMLSTNQKNGLYVSDECFKMATTDAISVACKQLGVGADVYWSAGRTKYSNVQEQSENVKTIKISKIKADALKKKIDAEGVDMIKFLSMYNVENVADITEEQFSDIATNWTKKVKASCV